MIDPDKLDDCLNHLYYCIEKNNKLLMAICEYGKFSEEGIKAIREIVNEMRLEQEVSDKLEQHEQEFLKRILRNDT